MTRTAVVVAAAFLLGLGACAQPANTTNVADTENAAGAALENSAAELEATTDNLVDGEVANIGAEANGVSVEDAAGNNTSE